ncbi:transposase [Escherichia coli]|nr:transposase [Escherichia coli]CAD5642909.1 transposase [Escherichia coli]SQN22145.1 transposase [Escherichia coli]
MDENKLKALATELAKGLKTEADLNQFSRMLTKLTVETALNAELTDHLGYEKNGERSEFCVTLKILQRHHIIQPPFKING